MMKSKHELRWAGIFICGRCGAQKKAAEFSKTDKGRQSTVCLSCRTRQLEVERGKRTTRLARLENREKKVKLRHERDRDLYFTTCPKCQQKRHYHEFYRKDLRGLQFAWCWRCRSAHPEEWKKQDPDREETEFV